jgi:hypothetical protein
VEKLNCAMMEFMVTVVILTLQGSKSTISDSDADSRAQFYETHPTEVI